jgi:arylsulfatase A-like enzyme
MFRRIALFGLAALLAALAACMDSAPPDAVAKPNVILIVIDTLRTDHLGDFGYTRSTDGPLQEFFDHSTVFQRAYAPASWTSPSVASLFTGQFTVRHRTNAHGGRLPDDALTLAEVLTEGGWHTAAFSFNHNVSRKTGFEQGFAEFDDFLGAAVDYPDMQIMMDRVSTWLDARPTTPFTPFFVYLQPMNVHGPYRTPEKDQASLLGAPPGNEFVFFKGPMASIMREHRFEARERVQQPYLQSLIDQYDTAIHYSTQQVAAFLKDLKRRDLYDDALIIITSDHGEELFDHGGFAHGYTLHDEVLHVPLYWKLPGQMERREINATVTLMDVFSTVLDVLEIELENDVDGVSLRDYLSGDIPPAGPSLRFHQVSFQGRCNARAIASEKYKLIEIDSDYEGRHDETLLYDLEADPGERHNIARQRPDVVRELSARLDQEFSAVSAERPSDAKNVREELDEERLRALGYID